MTTTQNGTGQAQDSAERPFIISHSFDAPRELLWKTWTERAQLMQWFGPKGFTMPAAIMDFRPGGMFHYCLCSPDGNEMWGKWLYQEIHAPDRIVLLHSFSDENGDVTVHPMAPTWPLVMLSTTTFAEDGNRTRLTIQWAPHNASRPEVETFNRSFDGMRTGWSGTFEQLSDYLRKIQSL